MVTRGSVVSIITTLLWLTGAAPALPLPGTLDTTFSGDGKVVTNFTPRGDFIWATALQADGKIVAAGGAGVASGGAGTFALARYDTDGTLDSTFGGDGRVVTQMTLKTDVIQAVAIQADQKIIAAGRVGGGGGRYGLARYNPDGTLDTSFGGDGKVMREPHHPLDAPGVAIQPDGKIVVVGASGWVGEPSRRSATTPRAPSTPRSVQTARSSPTSTGDDWAWDVALQNDGKIVVAGVAWVSRSDRSVALVRYNANGSLDTSFGGDGKVMRNLTPGWDDASGIEIQADGKLVTAGAAGGLGGQLLVLRIEADGTPDTTFSGDGKVATNFTTRDDFAWDLALQADGKSWLPARLVEERGRELRRRSIRVRWSSRHVLQR